MLPNKRIQTPENRAQDIEGVLDWTRNNDLPPEELQSIPLFKKLPQEPNRTRPVEDRMKDLDRTLPWMRNKDDEDDVNDSTSEVQKIDSILPKKPNQLPDDWAEEIEQVLDWLRTEGVKLTNNKEKK